MQQRAGHESCKLVVDVKHLATGSTTEQIFVLQCEVHEKEAELKAMRERAAKSELRVSELIEELLGSKTQLARAEEAVTEEKQVTDGLTTRLAQ